MKGNTIVRKLKVLNNKLGQCYEYGQDLNFEEKHCGQNHKKEKARLNRYMNKLEKTYNNIWRRNVPNTPLKAEVDSLLRDTDGDFVPCPYCGLPVQEENIVKPVDYCHHD